MNLVINSKLNACYPTLSKPTLITYTSNVCKILELVNAKTPEYLYTNYEDVIAKIKKEHKFDNTQKNKFAACNSIIKCYITPETKTEVENAIQKYIVEINILKNKIKKDLSTNEASDKEKVSWITKEQAKQIDTILESKVKDNIDSLDEFIPLRDLVLFRFYQQISTRAELCEALFFFDDEIDRDKLDTNFNYIHDVNQESLLIEDNFDGSFYGFISILRIYDKPLTYNEILQNYNFNANRFGLNKLKGGRVIYI